MSKSASQGILKDVAIIRPILIVLLVFYHAFAPFSGAWAPIEGFPEISAYWWLGRLSSAFMLEMFVFISGFVFGYQVRNKGEVKLEAKRLFWGKFKRLIIPSMIFSLLYIILLQNIAQPMGKTIYEIANGVAHMWFLPMLFWCFVGVWLVEKLHIPMWIALSVFILMALLPIPALPLRLTSTCYYISFFYTGYLIKRKGYTLEWMKKPLIAMFLSIAFFVTFPILTIIKQSMTEQIGGEHFVTIFQSALISHSCKAIYASIGIGMTLSIVGYFLRKHPQQLPKWLIDVGGLCMGVYLLQQFLLMGLYNYTGLPMAVNPYLLPWIGFVLALLVSVVLSFLINKNGIGRFLFGS